MTESTTLQKALIAIKKLKKLLIEKNSFSPIAIIGMGCRFPGVENKDDYWKLLSEGKNSISPLPEARWDLLDNTQESQLREKSHSYLGGYLKNITDFDAYFFGISPREAVRMDPQQRILLEVAYEAIEDAGLTLDILTGSNTGVFSSLYASQFGYMQEIESELDALFIPTGNALSIAANRLSYLLDLHGPSMVIDTACSSSLVALQLACLNLQNNLCDLAFVCGININLLPSINLLLTKAKMLSPDGQCKTFDTSANGYVPGEGCGVLVLKSLQKAQADQDRIYAVINGLAINQDGKTNGLTAPNGSQQVEVLKAAYQFANIEPSQLSYIECHGTGTFLGDPIEIQALGDVISKNRDPLNPCWVGSVKTNLGHLEPAAGMASIIKVALSLQHSKIPPHLNFKTPNPHIPFAEYHLQIPTQLEEWPKYGTRRIAGISGFGFGGQNAHAVLSEYLSSEENEVIPNILRDKEIFTLSAKDPTALQELTKAWLALLTKAPTLDIAQLCYNTHVKRNHYNYRLAIVVENTANLKLALTNITTDTTQAYASVFLNTNLKSQPIMHFTDEVYSLNFAVDELAKIYVSGAEINWRRYEEDRFFPMLDMPLYPWQRKKYWPKLINVSLPTNSLNTHPFNAEQISSPLGCLQFQFRFDARNLPELRDTFNVLHAGYYLEMLAYAVNKINTHNQFSVEDLTFVLALMIPDNTLSTVQLILNKNSDGNFEFNFYSYNAPSWIQHAKGTLKLALTNALPLESIQTIKQRSVVNDSAEKIYEKIKLMNMPTGESIRWSKHFWARENEILCQLEAPTHYQEAHEFNLNVHPGIIDGCIQPLFKLLPDDNLHAYMAAKIGAFNYYGMKQGLLYLICHLLPTSSQDEILGECFLVNEENQLVAEIKAIHLTKLKKAIAIDKLFKHDSQAKSINLQLLNAKSRHDYVTNFLMDQVATIFSMPTHDISCDVSLTEMGIDSLMALVLAKTIEQEFQVSYEVAKILGGPTITELVGFVLNLVEEKLNLAPTDQMFIPHTIAEDKWIAFREGRAAPRLRLFCLPYGGGGASLYRDWQNFLPQSIEVCPIQLPGRETRLDEGAIDNMDLMVGSLLDSIQNEFDLPFAFFGHSFGALIAFEVTRRCRKLGLPNPDHLFLSAFPAPRTPTTSLDTMLKELNAININFIDLTEKSIANLTEKQLSQMAEIFRANGILDYGDYLLNKNVMTVLLPIFISDMRLVKTYHYREEAPLNVPLTVFVGTEDKWVSAVDHLDWEQETLKKCSIIQFPAGHLFVKENNIKKTLLNTISQSLHVLSKNSVEQN